jgi:hypothetical protein
MELHVEFPPSDGGWAGGAAVVFEFLILVIL